MELPKFDFPLLTKADMKADEYDPDDDQLDVLSGDDTI